MIKTTSTCSNPAAKTAEILSRYRPIAPNPEIRSNSVSDGSPLSQKIKQSSHIRNLWPQLQARSARARKRGRAPIELPSLKKQKTHILGFCPPCHATSPDKNLPLQNFAPSLSQLPLPNHGVLNCSSEKTATTTSIVTIPCSPSVLIVNERGPVPELDLTKPGREQVIDLNIIAEIPEERDLLQQLQGPTVSNVIAQHPVRPVGSSISVGCISEDPSLPPAAQALKRPEDVEEDVESEALLAVISDSNNKVRMANSAY